MKILTNSIELSYLNKIDELFFESNGINRRHKKAFHACVHVQGYPSGYNRLRTALNAVAELINGTTTLEIQMSAKEFDQSELDYYKNLYPGIPDVQACLIYLMNNALAANALFDDNLVTRKEKCEFIKELYYFIRKVEDYLPEDLVSNIHAYFYKGIPEAITKSFLEIRKNARLIAQGCGDQRRRGFSFFKTICDEMGVKIAAYTGNADVHSVDEAEKIAIAHFGRPSC